MNGGSASHGVQARNWGGWVETPVPGEGCIAVGNRRSYSDAALNTGGEEISCEECSLLWTEDGFLAGAGVTLGEISASAAHRGLRLPVLPGSAHVTLGGAIAADVHGKNHSTAGNFSRCVEEIELLEPSGLLRTVGRGDPLWVATVGGMGLTGMVLRARLRLHHGAPQRATWQRTRTRGFLESAARIEKDLLSHTHAYARLLGDGRGLVESFTLSPGGEPAACRPAPAVDLRTRRTAPAQGPALLRAAEALLWHTHREARTGTTGAARALHPLDRAGWIRHLGGASGFIQYQCAAPDLEVLVASLGIVRRYGFRPHLITLKRLGGPGEGLLSFALDGWTLTMDHPVPVSAARWVELRDVLLLLDREIAAAHGKVYLAKNPVGDPAALRIMYPGLVEFERIRGEIDPGHRNQSQLSRRLHIGWGESHAH